MTSIVHLLHQCDNSIPGTVDVAAAIITITAKTILLLLTITSSILQFNHICYNVTFVIWYILSNLLISVLKKQIISGKFKTR